MTDTTKTAILSSLQVEQIIQRIAHQILENHYDEQEIILVGISNKGFQIAKKINAVLSSIAESKITLLEIKLDKDFPLDNPIELSEGIDMLFNKAVILIDDVLNSGRTLIFATRFLLEANPKQLSIAALVDRRHRKFPVRADYVGLTLSTTLKEHISVLFNDNGIEVFLD